MKKWDDVQVLLLNRYMQVQSSKAPMRVVSTYVAVILTAAAEQEY